MKKLSPKIGTDLLAAAHTGEPEDFRKYRSVIGGLMGELYLEMIEPILKEHPSLTPRGWDWVNPKRRA